GTVQAGVNELLAGRDDPESERPGAASSPHPTAGLQVGRRPVVCQPGRVRRPGGGAKLTEAKDPAILATLEQLVENEVAGDPMGETKWVRTTLRRLSEQLAERGHQASPPTVRRLLVQLGFAMRGNRRRQVHSKDPQRDEQFRYIASQRARFLAAGLPVISVDTKKKELIGHFKNDGEAWCKEADEVDEHDFPSTAECRAVPFGIYDLARNTGYVVVGVSNNTPEFAVKAIAGWWEQEGRLTYPGAKELLILADGGGGNGSRARAWKLKLQECLCDGFGLEVTICHYPPGCSKWNPVEHRLFSQISRNWAGKPLRALAVMLAYIRGTTTTTGLKVTARLDEGVYRKGFKVPRQDMDLLKLRKHDTCPVWNYTISPRNESGLEEGAERAQCPQAGQLIPT
ncbi:MAG: ISAzo13 family transposase, partial [Gemmatimonadales bacterium]